ncbi:MAG TPA: hypothetical protein VGO84_10595 [Burkholderiales bacterium]|nr:hypothetical protein [Burkholderiales bacterium]
MDNRFGKWRHLWMALAVIWTLIAAAAAWIELPRAAGMPHDPQFVDKLSSESAQIVRGPAVADKRAAGEPEWSDIPRLFRMQNGRQLEFPAFTTADRAAVVAGEYRELLDVQASQQRWPFLLARLAWWLAPLLVAGLAFLRVIGTGRASGAPRGIAFLLRSNTAMAIVAEK